jgi:hypothetical protein
LIFHLAGWTKNGGENTLWSQNGHKGFTPKLRGSKQHFSERFGGFLLHAGQQVTVRIQCHPYVRVAEAFSDDFGMYALFEQQRCVRMPQVMEADIRKTSLFDQRLERTGKKIQAELNLLKRLTLLLKR